MKRQTIRGEAVELLAADLVAAGCPPPIREYKFHAVCGWRFDLAWTHPNGMPLLAIEVDGKGRHQTDRGKIDDDQKLNAAIECGWHVLRYAVSRVKVHKRRARIVEQIRRVLHGVRCDASSACVLVGD